MVSLTLKCTMYLTFFFFFSLQFKSTPGAKNEFAENVIELLKLSEMGS